MIGSQIAAAIEYGVAVEVREAQGAYETRLEAALEEIGRLGTIQSSMALKLTMRQIRTLRQRDRDENALAIFRTNFPEFEYKPDEEVRQIIAELNDIERKAGRAELMKTKIIKSNIHTVLKPLDHEWNSRFGMGLMQISPSIVQKRAKDLLTERVENPRQFDIWQGKVFELFVDALVFNGYAGRKTKPVGTIDPGQLRLYRRNWSEWCEKNCYKVLEFASQKTIEELTKDRTRSYNMNAELRKQNQIQQMIMEKMRHDLFVAQSTQRKETIEFSTSRTSAVGTESAANSIKLVARLQKNETLLEAERTWGNEVALSLQSSAWASSILEVWGGVIHDILFTLIFENKTDSYRIGFKVSSIEELEGKLGKITFDQSTNHEDYFPERGGSTRTAAEYPPKRRNSA